VRIVCFIITLARPLFEPSFWSPLGPPFGAPFCAPLLHLFLSPLLDPFLAPILDPHLYPLIVSRIQNNYEVLILKHVFKIEVNDHKECFKGLEKRPEEIQKAGLDIGSMFP